MYIPIVIYSQLREADILLYRSSGFFWWTIRIFEAIKAGNWRHIFKAFTHQAWIVYDRKLDKLRRYDAMEGRKTGFRSKIGKAYVFRWKKEITPHQLMLYRQYLLTREWTEYDKLAIFWFWVEAIKEDPFKDVCSELYKNAHVCAGIIEDVERMSPYWFYVKHREEIDFIWIIQ